MDETPPTADILGHRRRKMAGRNIAEAHRAATPLELLFDLTFVLAFALGASEYAHALSEGHFATALIGFAFASFGICWAWINFSWFASAYDTDDWIFRLITMVQMIGALVFATGLPAMFESLEHGGKLDISVMVLGYVVMRFAMVFQWLRAAREHPDRRKTCLTYATAISIAQIGWVSLVFLKPPLPVTFALVGILIFIEMLGPFLAERKEGGTPWHAHHISERYGLFAIIALGEGIVGTVATLSAVVEKSGWTTDAALVCIAGMGLTFGMWWVFFMLPSAYILQRNRSKSFVWGYGQIGIVAAIVATGAGLHTAANFIEHKAHIGALQTLLCVAIPVAVFLILVYALYWYMMGCFDKLHIWLLSGTAAVVALAVFLAVSGVAMTVCLVVLMLAPVVTVVGYEVSGHRHQAEAHARQAGH